MTLNAGINVLVNFYINTLSFLYSLRLPGGGAIAPLAPPKSATEWIYML